MTESEDGKIWPPTPTTPEGAPMRERPARTPFLALILVMWGVTLAQLVLMILGLNTVSKPFGVVGFVLAVILVTRRDRAAVVNGGCRLLLAVFGFLLHWLGIQ